MPHFFTDDQCCLRGAKKFYDRAAALLLLSPIIQLVSLVLLYALPCTEYAFMVLGFTDTVISNSSQSAADFQSCRDRLTPFIYSVHTVNITVWPYIEPQPLSGHSGFSQSAAVKIGQLGKSLHSPGFIQAATYLRRPTLQRVEMPMPMRIRMRRQPNSNFLLHPPSLPGSDR
jgi:hypothetical protein